MSGWFCCWGSKSKSEDPVENSDSGFTPTMRRYCAFPKLRNAQLILPVAMAGFLEAFSYMIVAPSLTFYVQNTFGGTKAQYGYVLSAFSFASFCFKPTLGYWTDVRPEGNKFRVPYLTSISVAGLGGLVYFYASAYADSTSTALALVFTGRIMGGVGAANIALGYAYLATVIPPEEQTQAYSLLNMTRVIGMAAGPGFNFILNFINATLKIGSRTLQLDPINSVGLFLFLANVFSFLFVYRFLVEPGPRDKFASDEDYIVGNRWTFLKEVFSFEILLSIYTIFVLNSSFDLIETALAPAAHHALGWGTVQTSAVLGSSSVLLFFCMVVVFFLSSKDTKDETLVVVGCVFLTIGGFLLYFLWTAHSNAVFFILPVLFCTSGLPFIAASNRAIFTRCVDAKPALETRYAVMQAVLSMAASAAGFVTPAFAGNFVLQTSDQVDHAPDNRELSPWALYSALLPIISIIGMVYIAKFKQKIEDPLDEEFGDPSSLLLDNGRQRLRRRSSIQVLEQMVNPRTQARRRMSVEMMGIVQFDSVKETQRRSSIVAEIRRRSSMVAELAAKFRDEMGVEFSDSNLDGSSHRSSLNFASHHSGSSQSTSRASVDYSRGRRQHQVPLQEGLEEDESSSNDDDSSDRSVDGEPPFKEDLVGDALRDYEESSAEFIRHKSQEDELLTEALRNYEQGLEELTQHKSRRQRRSTKTSLGSVDDESSLDGSSQHDLVHNAVRDFEEASPTRLGLVDRQGTRIAAGIEITESLARLQNGYDSSFTTNAESAAGNEESPNEVFWHKGTGKTKPGYDDSSDSFAVGSNRSASDDSIGNGLRDYEEEENQNMETQSKILEDSVNNDFQNQPAAKAYQRAEKTPTKHSHSNDKLNSYVTLQRLKGALPVDDSSEREKNKNGTEPKSSVLGMPITESSEKSSSIKDVRKITLLPENKAILDTSGITRVQKMELDKKIRPAEHHTMNSESQDIDSTPYAKPYASFKKGDNGSKLRYDESLDSILGNKQQQQTATEEDNPLTQYANTAFSQTFLKSSFR